MQMGGYSPQNGHRGSDASMGEKQRRQVTAAPRA